MTHTFNQSPRSRALFQDTPTRSVDVGGTAFVYREVGPKTGVPVILLNHLPAQLDNFDPRIVDGLAATRRVIAFDYRGIGASGGKTPSTIPEMARDAVAFIRALGFEEVDLFGFSLGGFVAQEIVLTEPELVRKLILAGTGPAGGEGIDKVTPLTIVDMIKGALTFRDPKYYLFFHKDAERPPCREGIFGTAERAPDQPGQGDIAERVRRATQSDQGLRTAGTARSERHPRSYFGCEWRSGQDGAEQQ